MDDSLRQDPLAITMSRSHSSQILFPPKHHHHHLNNGRLHQAISVLDSATNSGTQPYLVALSLLLNACTRSREFALGHRVHSYLMGNSTRLFSIPSLISTPNVMTLKWRLGFLSLWEIKKYLVSWSALMSCFVNNVMKFDAITAFINMLEGGYLLNEFCYSAITRACSVPGNLSFGNVVHVAIVKGGLINSNVCVGCTLIDMYVKVSADLDTTYKLFDKMSERNVITWMLTITRCMQLGYEEAAV